MKPANPIVRFLTNVQILSALIWAFTIIACAWVADKSTVSTILIIAAGAHFSLLNHFQRRNTKSEC